MGLMTNRHSWLGAGRIAGKASAAVLAGLLTFGLGACAGQSSTSGAGSAESTAAETSAAESTAESAASQAVADFETKTNVTISADQKVETLFDALDEGLCSWNMGGTDASAVEGDDYGFAPVMYVASGKYQADKSLAGDDAGVTDGKISSTGITVEQTGVNGIVVNDSELELENVKVNINTPDADGTTSSDFSGKGSALAVYGDSDVTVRDSVLTASGVANLAAFADNGASLLLDGVSLSAAGGTLYEDYVNSPKQTLMVAPPWILGIMGNARGTNLMGTESTMTVVDSAASASNWAVLSTDAGSNMALNVVNTSMNLTGSDAPFQDGDVFNVENPYTSRSGYGTYAIGDATETFLGTTMNVGTYATIFTGGSGYYGNLTKGESYDLKAADGSTHTTYTAEEDAKTVIESDTFGFMSHKGDNTVEIDGATVHSAYTGFLMKSGNNTDVTVKGGAEVSADNGILVQLMDNDDSTTDYDSESEAFATVHEENAGFPTEAVSSDSSSKDAESSDAADSSSTEDASSTESTESASDSSSSEQGGPGGAAPSGEAPSGEAPSNDGGTPPELPSGEAPSGEAPSGGAPSGEAPSGEAPSGEAPTGGEGGPGGEAPSGEAPSGEAPSGGEGGPGGGEGGPGESGSSGSNQSSYTIEDTDLEGSIYNGIGWKANDLSDGNVKAMTLDVKLTGTSTLRGAIASTSCIHASYDGQQYLKENGITAFDDEDEAAKFADSYQLTSFTKAEYFNIGQVANLVKSNGLNDINVSLAGTSVWTVSDTSLVASLKVADDAKVVVEKGVKLTVGETEYGEGTYTASDFA